MRLAPLAALFFFAIASPLFAQDAKPDTEKRAPDDSNLPPRATGEPDRPEAGGRSIGDRGKGLGYIPEWWPIENKKSPDWTQDRNWMRSRFWRLDAGEIQLEFWWRSEVHRINDPPRGADHLYQIELAMGILPGVQLDVYENFTKDAGDRHVNQEGNQIELRFSPFTYGQVPFNPTLYFEWHPRHQAPDKIEIRLLLGDSIGERFFFAVNGQAEWETGGDRLIEWGYSAAIGYEVVKDVLRVGAEAQMTYEFSETHQDPTDGLTAEAGPNLIFRPLALVKPEWGKHVRITYSLLFGLTKDSHELDSILNITFGA